MIFAVVPGSIVGSFSFYTELDERLASSVSKYILTTGKYQGEKISFFKKRNDKGKIDLHGRTISLLSIGVGFNKKLTGKENIYLSGLLLGFSEEQIKEKEKEIIDFADIGEFINKPVKTYSSGMYSKLAFAITAILETDIMLIDEVLSVGDVKFKEKSYNKMKELISDEHRTVIIVSHGLGTIKELCNEVLWLHEGKIKMLGKPEEVIPAYQEFMEGTN